jgi:hypothetical protein
LSYARSRRPVKLRSGCHPVAYRLPAAEARSENISGTRGCPGGNRNIPSSRRTNQSNRELARCTGTRSSQFARFSPRQSIPSPSTPAA